MKKQTIIGVALLGLAAFEGRAEAFSTGNHFAATERALLRAGFDWNAVRHVQAANYACDHFDNFDILPAEVQTRLPAEWNVPRIINVAKYLHADGLDSKGMIERELAWIEQALKKVVADAKAKRDHRRILSALGIASHAIQDFYSHSMFADVDWQPWEGSRLVTFEELPRDLWESPFLTGRWARPDDVKGLISGLPGKGSPYGNVPVATTYPRHGDAWTECAAESQKQCSLNHDGARRRNHLGALLSASEATFDLAQRVQAMVADTSLWASVTAPGARTGVDFAIHRAQLFSMAGGQWGFERSDSKVQLAFAAMATSCVPECDVYKFDGEWISTVIAMWTAAPPTNAKEPNLPEYFPPRGTPLFDIPQPTSNGVAAYVGTYDVLWGAKRGTMELWPNGSVPLTATLTIDGKAFKQTPVLIRNGGLDLAVLDLPRTAMLTGQLFLTAGELAGYLRDGAGVPDGFAARRRRAPVMNGGGAGRAP
jgi:hypothetical protein